MTARDFVRELRNSKAYACSNSDLGKVLFYDVIFWDSLWSHLKRSHIGLNFDQDVLTYQKGDL